MELAYENVVMVTEYIKTFGYLAPLIAFLLFVLQAALPIFPYVILAAAAGILFGFKWGVFLAWSGALFGACIAYWACRILGYEWMIKFLDRRFHYVMPAINPSTAFWSIVVAKIIPVVPTPLINVVAAISGVPFISFFTSSAIGKIPSAVLYTGLGLALFNTSDINGVLTVLGAFLLLMLLLKYLAKKFFPEYFAK